MNRKTFLTTIFVGITALSFIYLLLCLFYIRVPIIIPGCIFINGLSDMIFGNVLFVELGKNIYIDTSMISTLLFMALIIACIFTMKRTKLLLYVSNALYIAEMIYAVYLTTSIIVNYNFSMPLLFACALWLLIDFIIVLAHVRYLKQFNSKNNIINDKKAIADI